MGSNNIDDPILTLSAVTERGKPQLQLQWWSLNDSGRIFLTEWENSKDKWLICGPTGFNKNIVETIKSIGYKEEQIHEF